MPRPIILFTGQWSDLQLEELAQKAGEWGYQGLDLCCWGDHFEVQRALSDPEYCQQKLDLLNRHIVSIVATPDYRDLIEKGGSLPESSTPQGLASAPDEGESMQQQPLFTEADQVEAEKPAESNAKKPRKGK